MTAGALPSTIPRPAARRRTVGNPTIRTELQARDDAMSIDEITADHPGVEPSCRHDRLNAARLIDKLAAGGGDEITQEEIVFMLISFIKSEIDAQSDTRVLMAHFGSLAAILASPQLRLMEVLSRSEECASLLMTVRRAHILAAREPIEAKPILAKMSQLQDYLRVSLAHEEAEVVRLLLLNSRNELIKDELHAKGIVNHVPVYPREIVRRVIETNACALIIVHNHPCGNPKPSDEDIAMTRQLARVLEDIGAKLHDHIIVGRHDCISLRSQRLM